MFNGYKRSAESRRIRVIRRLRDDVLNETNTGRATSLLRRFPDVRSTSRDYGGFRRASVSVSLFDGWSASCVDSSTLGDGMEATQKLAVALCRKFTSRK